MAGTYSYRPPTKTEQPAQTGGTSGSKNRIYQKFEKTIELDELSLPAQEEGGPNKIQNVASMQYPLVKINDYMPTPEEIILLEINCTEFIPTITLKCTFLQQTFLSREMPKDGDIISVAIVNKADMLKPVRNDYVITGVVVSETATQFVGPTTMTFFGALFIPWISSSIFNFSFEGTTFDAMKKLAEQLGLGFATNEDNTDDKQVWLSGYTTTAEYIQRTMERAWKDDNSFYKVWIDIYYNLNFVNVNKQLMSSEEEIDSAAWLNNIDKDFTWGAKIDQNETIETTKVLSNYEGYRTTPFFINTWKPVNRSTNITFQVGTKLNCHMFEHNEGLYNEEGSQKYWSVPLEPTYDPDKIDKYILLRGRAAQNPNDRGKDLAIANYSYPEMYVKNPWMGIQYTISNPEDDNLQWDGNHHRNYVRSRLQNIINNKELEKLNVEVTVNGLNLNIIKGDKVPIVLIKKDRAQNLMVSPEAGTQDILEQFYSGWFYVKGFNIKYTQQNSDSIMSNITQTFVLTRREWPPPVAVGPIEPEGSTENNTV